MSQDEPVTYHYNGSIETRIRQLERMKIEFIFKFQIKKKEKLRLKQLNFLFFIVL